MPFGSTVMLDGTLGSFSPLSQPLPKALSFLGVANVGRFLCAVGGVLGVARATHGTAIESAFIYQLAGLGTGGVVLGSTEQTIW